MADDYVGGFCKKLVSKGKFVIMAALFMTAATILLGQRGPIMLRLDPPIKAGVPYVTMAPNTTQSLDNRTTRQPLRTSTQLVLPPPEPTLKPIPKQHVIVLAYMRSGSSLLGKMLMEDDEGFYLFEPLRGLYAKMWGSWTSLHPTDIHYDAAGTKRVASSTEKEAVNTTLSNIYSCHLRSITEYSLLSHFLVNYPHRPIRAHYSHCVWGVVKRDLDMEPGLFANHFHNMMSKCEQFNYFKPPPNFIKTEDYNVCMHQKTVFKNIIQTCGLYLEAACAMSKFVAVKMIRLSMVFLEDYLHKHPDTKVIHLTRDPRGIIHSWDKWRLRSVAGRTQIEKEATYLCDQMLEDIHVMERLQKVYPNMFLSLKYEDVVENSTKILEEVYRYVGLPVKPEVRAWLHRDMNSQKDGNEYDTYRNNPFEVANKWKSELTVPQMEVITDACRTVMETVHYDTAVPKRTTVPFIQTKSTTLLPELQPPINVYTHQPI